MQFELPELIVLSIIKDIYGEYDDKQKLMQKTYIVFSHSKFEFFIEEICVDISLKYFKEYKISNEILISLCHHYPIDRESFIKSPKYCESFDPIRVIEDTVNFYKQNIIRDNHGIRKEHISKLLSPLGYPKVPVTLLSNFEKLSNFRGEYAHKSAIYSTTIKKQIDINDIEKTIAQILDELKTVSDFFSEKELILPY